MPEYTHQTPREYISVADIILSRDTAEAPIQYASHKTIENQSVAVKANAYDVAAYILWSLKDSCTTMKLHKLLYYCQAWSLVWDEAPLFDEAIEAWANGPVVRNLYNYHKGLFSISYNHFPIGNKDALTDSQKETVNAVLEYYGKMPAQALVDLTHHEDPWLQARKGLMPNERGSNEISLSSMAEYYSALAR